MWLTGTQDTQSGYAGQRMIHVPDRTEQDRSKFHHTTQNSRKFETYELFNALRFIKSEKNKSLFLNCA